MRKKLNKEAERAAQETGRVSPAQDVTVWMRIRSLLIFTGGILFLVFLAYLGYYLLGVNRSTFDEVRRQRLEQQQEQVQRQ